MKEIHAYRNEDGTYSIHAIYDDVFVGDQWHCVKGYIPRAKIQIEALEDHGSGKIFDIEVDDEIKEGELI